MMQHICDKCNKSFKRNSNLQYHILNNICTIAANKDKNYMCKFCKSYFSCQPSLSRHVNHFCKVKKNNDNQKNIIFNNLIKLEQEKLHKDDDNDKQNNFNNRLTILEEKNNKLEGENKELKKELDELKKSIKTDNKSIKTKKKSIITNNNINNGTINNTINNNNNIILVSYGNEDMAKIDKKEILKALGNGFFSSVKLTKTVHFNPKYPEYHNVFISNIKNRYAMMYSDGIWELITKEKLINQIYEDKKAFIEENFEEFVDSLVPSRKKALQKWLEMDEEEKTIKDIKEQLKLLLYNYRKLIENSAKIENTITKTITNDIDGVTNDDNGGDNDINDEDDNIA